jgi:diguanylate cyclase (GGDEF)-like protein
MRILVIEDDGFIAEMLTVILTNQNYTVEVAANGSAGKQLVEAFDYDLVLLDVMLPGLDGITLCRQIRSIGLKMPILLLTGRDSPHDKAIGLDAGADDYLVKPFDTEELLARVRALLRRASAIAQPILEWGDLQLDPTSCEVTYLQTPVALTPKEYALLELFLRNPRRVFSCGLILEHLWAYEETPGEDTVRTHIKGLRHKIKAAGAATDVVETIYGIGYRLKANPTHEVDTSAPSIETTTPTNPGLKSPPERFEQIWLRYQVRAHEQLGILDGAIQALTDQTLDDDLRLRARREAHTLAGSLGMFGVIDGSNLARQIEAYLELDHPLQPSDATQLRDWLETMRHAIAQRAEAVSESSLPSLPEPDQPVLLIVDGDATITQTLQAEASTWGFRADVATSLNAARAGIQTHLPDVVLLDPAAFSTLDSYAWLLDLSKQVPPIPVIVFTEDDDLSQRLDVARLGGRTFLQKLTDPAQVFEVVHQVLNQADRAKAGVMIVDDDPALLAVVRSLLEPWGLKVTTLSNPQQFWDVLEAVTPDLLILDIAMPHISGLELCQIVRNDSRWGSLPILFLTAHTDPNTVNQVFAMGADDFVSKPIVGPELVTRIINRLERIRFLRALADTDPLTKVASRQKSTQDIDTFLRLAKRQHQPFCLAILDLDHFKHVNDRYGHATGDQVLYQMGKLLRRSFRNEDVVARWGGEEFVIGLYGISKEAGIQRLNRVLDDLHQKRFTALNTRSLPPESQAHFQVTFSAGVAQYPQDGTDVHRLYQAADGALYQAKALGRDRVVGTLDQLV